MKNTLIYLDNDLTRRINKEYNDVIEEYDCYGNALCVGRNESKDKSVFLALGYTTSKRNNSYKTRHAFLKINELFADPTNSFIKNKVDNYYLNLLIKLPLNQDIDSILISNSWNQGFDPRYQI